MFFCFLSADDYLNAKNDENEKKEKKLEYLVSGLRVVKVATSSGRKTNTSLFYYHHTCYMQLIA